MPLCASAATQVSRLLSSRTTGKAKMRRRAGHMSAADRSSGHSRLDATQPHLIVLIMGDGADGGGPGVYRVCFPSSF